MRTGVDAPRTAKRKVELLRGVVRNTLHTAHVVAHQLLANQIGLLGIVLRQAISNERRILLILLVEAIAIGVEGRGVHRPSVVETVRHEQLVVQLEVVVRLIVVVGNLRTVGQRKTTFGRGILAAIVVATTIKCHILLRHTVVGEVGLGLTTKREEFHDRIPVVVGSLHQIGAELGRGAINIAIRADVRQTSIQRPMATHQTRRNRYGLLLRVVGTIRERGVTAKLGRERSRRHRNSSAKGTRTVGRNTRTTLHLHRSDGRNQVGCVVPIHRVGIGVIHRYAVDRHIQARGICTAQAHRSTADTDTRLVRGNHRGGQCQQCGDVCTVTVAGEALSVEVGIGYGRLFRRASTLHFNLLEMVKPYGVLLVGMGNSRKGYRQKKKKPFHRFFGVK